MYLRLWRRIPIAKHLTLNLSNRGPSLSYGVRGAHFTLGRRGLRETAGLPGTGLYLTHQQNLRKARAAGWSAGLLFWVVLFLILGKLLAGCMPMADAMIGSLT